jgi:hypothetical protein
MADILFAAGIDGPSWQQSLQQTQDALQQTVGSMAGAFGPLSETVRGFGSVFEGLAAPITRVTALFAGLVSVVGGAAFKAGIDESRQLTGEALRLANTLGIASDAASALNTALGDIGADSDTYLSAFNHFSRAIKSNEDQLRAMGLQTRDANGNLRDASTLMQEALSDVNEYQRGLDQTTAAMTYFGKSIDDARKLQRLNADVLEEAKQKNEQLGLTITKNNVEATRKYRDAMNDLGDVLSALKKTIGDAVMPIFAEMANWLAAIGPAAVMVLHGAVASLATIFWGLKSAVVAVWETLGAFLYTVTEPFLTFGRAFAALMRGEWTGAVQEFSGLAGRIGGAWRNAWQAYSGDAQKSFEEIKKVWSDQSGAFTPKSGKKTMPAGGKGDGKASAEPSGVAGWEEVLNNWKIAYQKLSVEQGSFQQLSKTQEAEYWRNVLAYQTLTDKERQAVTAKYVAAEGESQKQRFAAEIATLRASEVEWQNNAERRLEIVRQQSAAILAVYGAESREYQDARRREAETERAVQQQLQALRMGTARQVADQRIAEVDMAQRAYQSVAALHGQTLAEQLQADLQFEQQRYEIRRQYAEQNLAGIDPRRDRVRYAEASNQLLELERQYQGKRQDLILGAQAKASEPMKSMFDGMQSSLNGSLKGVLTGTQSWASSMRSLFGAVGDTIVEELVTKPLAAMLVGWIKKRAIAMSEVATNAAVAGSGAAASSASIPFVGWLTALPAMASVFAGVMGMSSSIPSAAAGWDIPSGINPLAQLHEREMVLPAEQADAVRDMASGGAAGMNVSIYAMDAQSLQQYVHGNRDVFAQAMHDAYRNGWRPRG